MKVGLVFGFWGQNIGNSFFNIGADHILKEAGHEVFLIQDHPAYWTFRDESKGSYENRFPLVESLDLDLLILQGPLFTRNFGNIWRKTLIDLADKGIPWACLSAGFRSYNQEERDVLSAVIERTPPLFISTRDRDTYDMLNEIPATKGRQLRDGICSAFFLPHAYKPPRMTIETVSICFDHYLEPDFVPDPAGLVELSGTSYRLDFPERLESLAHKTKGHAYVAHAADRRKLPESIGGCRVVRPEHRTNPHIPVKIYRQPGAMASDEPYSYLTAYSNSQLTISDRVHACVAALTYGSSAMMHNPGTKRSALFARAGVPGISERPQRISQDLLSEEYGDVLKFLASVNELVH